VRGKEKRKIPFFNSKRRSIPPISSPSFGGGGLRRGRRIKGKEEEKKTACREIVKN